MAERQNTGNAIPSNALADLNDNTIILDEFANSASNYTKDRFGKQFRTLRKYINDLEAAIAAAQQGAYVPIAGGTMTGPLVINAAYPQVLLKTAINQHQIIANPSGDFYLYLQDSNGVGATRLRYSATLNRWDFYADDVLINNSPALKRGDAALINKSSNGDSRERYARIAVGKIQNNQYSNLSLLIAGGGGGGSGNNQIDAVNLSTRGAASLRQISIESPTRDTYYMKYGYIVDENDNVEFWIKSPAWSITPQITTISAGNIENYLKQESISWVYEEPDNIIYVNAITQVTSANIVDYVQNKIVAWGRFDYSTNNSINIIASSGVSSITRSSTGKYLVTLSNSIAGAKYAVTSNAQEETRADNTFAAISLAKNTTSNQFELWISDNNTDDFKDTSNCHFIVAATY